MGLPTYHLAAMVDDHHMKITHVLRGAEWLSTFPLHVNVVRAFGWEEPTWVHLSLFLKPSGKGKLSKRDASEAIKDGYSVFVKDLQDLGFIPEGVLNWIVLMGWGVAEDDVLTVDDMVRALRPHATDGLAGGHQLHQAGSLQRDAHPPAERQRFRAAREAVLRVRWSCRCRMTSLERIAPLIKGRLTTLDDAPRMAGFFFRERGRAEAGRAAAERAWTAGAGAQHSAGSDRPDREDERVPGRSRRGRLPGSGGPTGPFRRRGVRHLACGRYRTEGEPTAVPEHGDRGARAWCCCACERRVRC